jgi:hypothetical protein
MPKPKALAGLFGTDEEEELPALPPEEELNLEDLDDDEEEGADTDILDLEGPEGEIKEETPTAE